MNDLKPQSTARLAAFMVLAAGILTGTLLAASPQQRHAVAAQLVVDPTIPALVIVGKRLMQQSPAAPTAAIAPPAAHAQAASPSTLPAATVPIAAAAGL